MDSENPENFLQTLYNLCLDRLSTPLPLEAIRNVITALAAANEDVPTEEEIIAVCSTNAGLYTKASAIYCLYCLFYAQPGSPTIKILVGKEHQAAILEAVPALQTASMAEPVNLLRRLRADHVLVPGALHRPANATASLENSNAPLAPGIAVFGISHGLSAEEAAMLREVRFHFDASLPGLGTRHLGQICGDYQKTLEDVWKAFGHYSDGEAGLPSNGVTAAGAAATPPHFVADLEVGQYIDDYIVLKQVEIKKILQEGRVREESKAADGSRMKGIQGTEAEKPRVRGVRPRRRQQRKAQREPARGAMAVGAEGLPVVARKLQARERARDREMRMRAQPWATRLGVDEEGLERPPSRQPVYDSEEDMPGLPGVVSAWEGLAGPSGLAVMAGVEEGSTGGGEATVQGDEESLRVLATESMPLERKRARSSSESSSESDESESSSADEIDDGI
jgi:hypothetical protein